MDQIGTESAKYTRESRYRMGVSYRREGSNYLYRQHLDGQIVGAVGERAADRHVVAGFGNASAEVGDVLEGTALVGPADHQDPGHSEEILLGRLPSNALRFLQAGPHRELQLSFLWVAERPGQGP